MLHIILLILKIFGLLLLGILGLALLLVIVILVSPAVYRLEASGQDTPESIRGKLRFHWLLCLISGELCYEDRHLTWHIRAGWRRFGSDMENNSSGDSGIMEEKLPEQRKEKPEEASSKQSQVHEKNNSPAGHIAEKERAESSESGQTGKKKDSLHARAEKFWEKIKYTIQKICDNIRSLIKKKERLTAFIQNEVHKSVFFKTVRELRRFLKTLRPREADVYAEFGFTDPAVTGYVLALISMIYPFIGEYTEILPDFKHKIFRGRIFVKGRIRAFHVVSFALRLLMDKNVRTTYRHIKKFKL